MTRKRALLVAIGFVGLGLFAQSVYMLGVERLVDGLRRVGWGFGAIVILSGAREAARTLAWVRTVEGPRLPFARAFRARLAGEALNTLLPMGMLVGEPVKASHVAPDLPFASAFGALVVEFAFYCISLVLLLSAGTTALIAVADPSLRPSLIALLVVSAVVLGALLPYVRRAGRRTLERTATFSAAGGRIRASIRTAVDSVQRQVAIVGRFAAEHPERVRAIVAFEIAYQVLAVAEVYFTLFLISPVQPTLAMSLVLETVNRVITMLFKMLPMRLGVDEASSSLFAGRLDLGATTGLTLALVRKLRMLFWGGIGLLFLLPRRSDLTAPAWSWSVVDQRVP
ncbi:MAG TPA: lysylphosphatidylglycerol synthase domain-containing protein [Vicinamibacterales bacterium]|nr:lysylphosphatidylglycerol synthase domain-containing protein [Vicinamibacterales bacterium]